MFESLQDPFAGYSVLQGLLGSCTVTIQLCSQDTKVILISPGERGKAVEEQDMGRRTRHMAGSHSEASKKDTRLTLSHNAFMRILFYLF